MKGTIVAPSNWDNDYFGLGFGYQAPIAANGDSVNRQKMVLLGWKQGDQGNFPPYGGLARAGFTVSKVDGSFQSGVAPFWQQSPGIDVLASHYGADAGWVDGHSYEIRARYTSTGLTVWLDGQVFASVTGAFEPGRLAMFDYSQQNVQFKDFSIRRLGGGVSVTADAGPDQDVVEGSTVTLHGAGTAVNGSGSGEVAYSWDAVSGDGPPVQLSSASSASPSFSVFDDATYRFRLTVTAAGVSDTDEVTVHVANAAPTVTRVEADPTTTDGVAAVTVTLSDPGPFDSHTVDVDWGDGTTSEGVPVSVDGSGWAYGIVGHRYVVDGPVTVTATAHDDDGDVGDPMTAVIDVGGAGPGELAAGASIWAGDGSDSKALWVTGSNNSFSSLTHANGGIKVSGSAHSFTGGTEYGSTMSVTGSGTVFDPAAVQAPSGPFPVGIDLGSYAPGGPVAASIGAAYHVVDSADCKGSGWRPDKPLVAGIYWVPCGVKISGSDVAGRVTIIASGQVHVSGSGNEFTPFVDGLVFASMATGDRAIQLTGSDQVIHGTVFAPSGEVKVSGSGEVLECGVYGATIRVSGSHNSFGGANCSGGSTGAGVVSIAAPPLLVPNLMINGVGASPGQVAPGDTVSFDAQVENGTDEPGGGASVFVPVELAALASGTTPVSVDSATFTLEAHDPATGDWTLVASSDPSSPTADVVLTGSPNPDGGVSYPTGGDGITGTQISPAGLASWAGIARIGLDTDTVNELLDPTRVDAVREQVTFTTSGGPARTMARFSVDPLAELRAVPGGTISDVAAHWAAGGIDPVTTDAADVAGLAEMSPGDAVPLRLDVPVDVVAPKGEAESDAAYLQRLGAVDGSKVFASVYATGLASPGTVYAQMRQASATIGLPVLTGELTAPSLVHAGDDVVWSFTVTNTGSRPATSIDAALTVDGAPVSVSGVPVSLEPGQSVAISASTPTDAREPDQLPGWRSRSELG